jgi:hypothetical protein
VHSQCFIFTSLKSIAINVQLVHLDACADIPGQFFSSYERLRLAKDGSYPIQVSPRQERKLHKINHSSTTQSAEHRGRIPLDRHFTFPITSFGGSRSRPATASHSPPAFGPSDTAFYESLPPTLRSKLFSREEQVLLASNRGSVIVDSADEVLYKRGYQTRPSAQVLPSAQSLPLFQDLDTTEKETLDDDAQMDHSEFEGFRWLDTPDEELDLTLDDYHIAITQATTTTALPTRKPSFRRNMSLSTISFSRRASASDQNTASTSPRHSTISSSQARPISSLLDSHKHRSHSSISSIDPSAKYYRDPEARLKLRVYLASPQKFDEAIEFGFPSLQDRQNVRCARPQTSPRITQDSGRTFFTDDTPSLSDGDDDDKDDLDDPDTPQDAEFRRFSKKSSSERTGITRPQLRIEPYALASTHDREMTLHMTLTRPDLRSAEEMKPAKKVNDLPLEHEALPCDDVPQSIWDTMPEDSSVVKKLWRRLRKI